MKARRGVVLIWLVWMSLLGCARTATAGESLYRFVATESWIKPAAADYTAAPAAGEVADGTWNLLFDRQINVTAAGDDYYQHSAVKVVSAGGVDEQSQLDFSVDPTFQTLDINSLRVVRRGQVIDQRRIARITALPQETELREKIYNGGYNVNVLLADVRIGDVVEFEYTMHSRSRTFPGHFSDRLTIGWSTPVHWQRLRVVSPVSRPLLYRVSDGQPMPAPTVNGAVSELNWEWHDLTAIAADDDRPKWYSTWPYLQISDLQDWSEVARQVVPLFVVKRPLSPAVTAVVNEIRNAGGTPETQALHALQFVQEQIRYVSISIGRGAYQPASPQTVLRRRFGDCKDKALLLATILQELGVEARPALVNSRRGRVLDTVLPTPYTFDHAIVRMQIGTAVYWLDGTADKQYSPLSTGAPANFERALVVDGSSTALERIPRPAPGVSAKRSEVNFDMRKGFDEPAKLQITTSYTGRLADSMRVDLADGNPEQRQTDYVNYIARYYPGAKTLAPIAIEDDKSQNIVRIREYYELPKGFKHDQQGRPKFFFQTDELYRYVDTLKSSVRKAPLAIEHPVQVEQIIRASLPGPGRWLIQNDTQKIDNPAFHYEATVDYSTQGSGTSQLTLDYRYQSLSDVVDVAALQQYIADRKRVYDDLGLSIKHDPVVTFVVPPPLKIAPLTRLVLFVSWVFGVWAAVRFGYRFDPQPARAEAGWPAGIRNWLWLPSFVVVAAPVVWSIKLSVWVHYLDVTNWNKVQSLVGKTFEPLVHAAMLVLAAGGVLLWVGLILMAVVFFRKRTSAPRIFIAVTWAVVAYGMAFVLFLKLSHFGSPALIKRLAMLEGGGAVRAGIYTAYMLLSKRVKATFVVRMKSSAPKMPIEAGELIGSIACLLHLRR